MVEPGSVNAGDTLIREYGAPMNEREPVKVLCITAEGSRTVGPDRKVYTAGVIILEDKSRFTPDGKPIGYTKFTEELHPQEGSKEV